MSGDCRTPYVPKILRSSWHFSYESEQMTESVCDEYARVFRKTSKKRICKAQ